MRTVYIALFAFIFLVLAGLFYMRASQTLEYTTGKGAIPPLEQQKTFQQVYSEFGEPTKKTTSEIPDSLLQMLQQQRQGN